MKMEKLFPNKMIRILAKRKFILGGLIPSYNVMHYSKIIPLSNAQTTLNRVLLLIDTAVFGFRIECISEYTLCLMI